MLLLTFIAHYVQIMLIVCFPFHLLSNPTKEIITQMWNKSELVLYSKAAFRP